MVKRGDYLQFGINTFGFYSMFTNGKRYVVKDVRPYVGTGSSMNGKPVVYFTTDRGTEYSFWEHDIKSYFKPLNCKKRNLPNWW
jgi:hypothetical protein